MILQLPLFSLLTGFSNRLRNDPLYKQALALYRKNREQRTVFDFCQAPPGSVPLSVTIGGSRAVCVWSTKRTAQNFARNSAALKDDRECGLIVIDTSLGLSQFLALVEEEGVRVMVINPAPDFSNLILSSPEDLMLLMDD